MKHFWSRFLGCVAAGVMCCSFSGCAIIMSSTLPVERSPERLVAGMSQERVDRTYGAPIATGMSADNKEYIEQIQFIDGTPVGWKIARIHIHSFLDSWTFFLWEIPGTIIEMCNDDYSEYTYFVIYDDEDNVVRKVPLNSPEGCTLSALPWASKEIDLWEKCDGVNTTPPKHRRQPQIKK
ncbi:MAG: hypothetical protein Q4F99_04905 [bacterium]|nr:hypothetical protein [bacterium]